jgi:hypothetical protein
MKGRLDKTEQGWVVRYLKPEPKYIGEKYSIQEIPIYPDYVALCSYSFYEGKEVEFEILQGADLLYAHLFTKNNKEQRITEDSDYPTSITDKIDGVIFSLPLEERFKCWDLIEQLIEEEKETLYTEEQVKFIVEKSRETGLTAEYLMLSLKQPKD